MKKRILVLVSLISLLGGNATPFAYTKEWNGRSYSKNKSVQFVGAVDQIQAHSFTGRESILDLGSGDGEITSILAGKTTGSVIGLDLNSSMVEFAQNKFKKPNLRFIQGEASSIQFKDQFDLITSFNTLHWIQSQKALLDKFYVALKKDGRLLLGIPTVLNQEKVGTSLMVKILQDKVKSDRWKNQFSDFVSPWKFSSEEEYTNALKAAHFIPKTVKITIKPFVLKNKTDFIAWMRQILPHLKHLKREDQNAFLEDVSSEYIRQVPLNDKGEVSLSHAQLEIAAIRSE